MTNEQLRTIEKDLQSTFHDIGQASPIKLLGEGWGSIAVEMPDRLVFRIAKNEKIGEQHKKQVAILPLIADTLPVKLPIPEYYSGPTDKFPFGVMGYQKIAGFTLTHSRVAADAERYAKQVARLLLAFHTMTPPSQIKESDYPGSPDDARSLDGVWGEVAAWLIGQLNKHDYNLVEIRWHQILSESGSSVGLTVLVQGDPWYENLIVDKSGGLVGIVDFDKLHIGDPAIDFGVQQYASADFMLKVIQRYREMGGKPGDNLEYRIKTVMQIKSMKDLAYCLRIGRMYSGTLGKIKKAFLQQAQI